MSPTPSTRIHEADFCAEVASYSNAIFSTHPEYPFKSARIEGFGQGSDRAKRKDLRVFDKSDRLILCGEVKLSGTLEGRSPYAEELVRDAHQKADNANVQYFFTWNVNLFVLWDRKKWDVPLLDRRIREWKFGQELNSPEDVGRPEILRQIQERFLPELLSDLAEICSGRRTDWAMPADDIFIRSMESHLEWPIALTRSWLSQQAGILERSGYVKAREGTNGFSCFVDRQSPLNLEPTCFDAEGSATTLQSRFLAEELRGEGKSEDEIKAAIEEGYKSGKFRAPQKPGIVYMMSNAGYIFVAEMNKMVHLPAHLMFYAPYASDKDIGSPPPAKNMPHLIRAGQPDAVIIVVPPVIPPIAKADSK